MVSQNADSVRLSQKVHGGETIYRIEALDVTIRKVKIIRQTWWEAERNGHICLFERLDDARYFFAGLGPTVPKPLSGAYGQIERDAQIDSSEEA